MYDTWLADPTQHEFTRGGNLKAQSHSLLCEWVKGSWDAVPVDMVENSFASCAITTSLCEEERNVFAEKIKDFGTVPGETDDPSPQMMDDPEEAENNEVCIEEDDEEDSDGGSSCDDN